MEYEHTQHGGWHYIVLAAAVAMLTGVWLAREVPVVPFILLATATVLIIVSFMFGSLMIRDEGEYLALRYGPLPIIRKRFRYADITSVEPDRTKIIDGWGIHYVLGRGWTYNLWGFGCTKLTLGRKVVRVGSDDVENLLVFLRGKVAEIRP